MDFAPLYVLIPSTLLILLAEPLLALPVPAHLCAGGLLAFSLYAWRHRSRGERARGAALLTELEEEAARCARRYRGVLEGVGNALFIFNADDGVLEESNGAAQELLGFSTEEMGALQGRELFPAEEQEKFRSLVYRLRRRGASDAVELIFQRKDGSRFIGTIEARLLELGSERLVAGIVRDISDKRRAEGELCRRNRELSLLNTVLTTLNEGKALSAVLEATLTQLMELMESEGGALHLMEKDRAPAPSVSRCVSAKFALELSGCIGRGMEQCRCVTRCGSVEGPERCRLSQSAARDGWGRLFAIPLTSQNRLIGVMHLLHRKWRSYSEEEIRFLATVGQQIGNALEHARVFAELDWKSGELMRSHRLLETSSRSLAASEIKLKQNLALVEQANADLKRVSALKNQFLGLVSHEFNTPLTSIIAGTEHLLQKECGEDAAVLEMVRDGGLRLKDLVGDLLNLVKLEAREGIAAGAPVHLKTELELVREELAPALAERQQTLLLSGLEELPFFVGDWKNLERVFLELIENAMKFTPDGGEIRVRGRVVDREALAARRATLERFNEGFLARCGQRCYLEVEVRDTGIGIPPEEQVGIFQLFYEIGDIRHHSSGKHKFQGKGAGLGLAIVKGMVEAHGGMVWVESQEGSSFFVLLPLEQELSQPELF